MGGDDGMGIIGGDGQIKHELLSILGLNNMFFDLIRMVYEWLCWFNYYLGKCLNILTSSCRLIDTWKKTSNSRLFIMLDTLDNVAVSVLVINGLKAWGNNPLPMWGSCEVVLPCIGSLRVCVVSLVLFPLLCLSLVSAQNSACVLFCSSAFETRGWVQLGETMSAISHMHFSIFSFKTNSPWNSGRTRPREWPHRWVHCLRPCLARVCCTVLFSLLEEGGIARRDWAEDFQPYFYRSTVDTQIALG